MYLEQGNREQRQSLDEQQPPPVENNLPEPEDTADQTAAPKPVEKKRNSGRTGATSIAGLARCALNALKHGACSQTLIIAGESVATWLVLLARWCDRYNAYEDDNSLEYDFVRKTAQAEWFRIRCQRNYDNYCSLRLGQSPFNWTPDELKMHDLLLRYKNSADRTFQREMRSLQQHYKFHGLTTTAAPKTKEAAGEEEEEKKETPPTQPMPPLTIVIADPESPTGYFMGCEIINGRESREKQGQPFTPPDPLPPHWRKFHFPEKTKE